MISWTHTSMRGVTRRLINKFRYSLPRFEREDLEQEAVLVHARLFKSHGRKECLAHLQGPITSTSIEATWMALYKTSVYNRFCYLVTRETRRVAVSSLDQVLDDRGRSGCVADGTLCGGLLASCGAASAPDDSRSVELMCDLEKAPALLALLEKSSWDDGKVRVRQHKRLPDGTFESDQVAMQRLAGRKFRSNYAEQLARVV